MYNVLADTYNDPSALTAIKSFVSVYTGGDSSSDDAESARLAEEVSAAYVSCIEVIAKGNYNYADIVQCAAFGEGSLDQLPSRRELPQGSQHGDDAEELDQLRFLKFALDVIPDAHVGFRISLNEASLACKLVDDVTAASQTTPILDALRRWSAIWVEFGGGNLPTRKSFPATNSASP